MPPAARVQDMTAHGTPLTGSGSPDVLIGGMPAWRAGADVHTCPLSTGAAPHVGGVVVSGSTTVLINGYPAARMGDVIAESGPPNTIVTGAPTVLVDSGTTSTEPSWTASLYDRLTTYAERHNEDVAGADLGTAASQLRGEVVDLYVTADEGEAEFSFRTTEAAEIRELERGTREDATLRMETDEATVDDLAGADDPVGAFQGAIVDGDVTITGIGTLKNVKWEVIDVLTDVAGFFELV